MNVYENRLERLCLDIDLRLRELWEVAYETNEVPDVWDLELVAVFMRCAYAHGYAEALREPVVAQLHRDHGYQIPTRASL